MTGDDKIVLSGMRSTGPIHLGNYYGAVRNWVALQERYRCYYFAADWHALTSDYSDPSRVADNTLQAVADWIAAGLDPERSVIFVQSMVPEHAELALLLAMITPLSWLERVPTYKEQLQALEGREGATYGQLGYPVLQAADILVYRAGLVPVGEDQAPHLELCREIGRRFNSLYGEAFPEPQALYTPAPRVPGIDGRKMSKSYGNAIFLSDPPEVIRARCEEMFTDPSRVRRRDPGHPEICNLFRFHELLSPAETRERVEHECRRALIGCVDDKRLLAERLIELFADHRQRRQRILDDRDGLLDLLVAGSRRARERARETLERVREAMAVGYRQGVEA